jgi:cytochrome c oxidase subunit 2
VADDAYLRRAILDPHAEKVAGYDVQMPKVDVSDRQLDELIAYIKSL